jgi:2-polyprenyl-3-methyl-5-hydroxy-6-metoxy-1,4-benzoquinol methylase
MFEPSRSVADRYNFNPASYSPNRKILNLTGAREKVLDVGCAGGFLARELKKKGCFVVGLEFDPEAAEEARQFCDRVIVGDIETLDANGLPQGFFDTIIFGDVLEHLRRPDMVVRNVKSVLSPGGKCIASIPNIARIEFRLKLLMGRFVYEDIGQLDKTHLRFFTLSTAKELFTTEGYTIQSVDYTGLASRFFMFRLLPTWFAYQIVIVARPMSHT